MHAQSTSLKYVSNLLVLAFSSLFISEVVLAQCNETIPSLAPSNNVESTIIAHIRNSEAQGYEFEFIVGDGSCIASKGNDFYCTLSTHVEGVNEATMIPRLISGDERLDYWEWSGVDCLDEESYSTCELDLSGGIYTIRVEYEMEEIEED